MIAVVVLLAITEETMFSRRVVISGRLKRRTKCEFKFKVGDRDYTQNKMDHGNTARTRWIIARRRWTTEGISKTLTFFFQRQIFAAS